MKEGLTFSDVLLMPRRTPLNSRSEAVTKTKVTKNVSLNIPLVSSNMASVTEQKMAIALARAGGIGIIHQFMKLEEQVEEVRRVKRSTSYIIEDPITASKDITIKEATELMNKKHVTSLLITENEKLIGIFTSRDYLFEEDENKRIFEVMTTKEKLITAKIGTTIEEAKKILHKNRIEKLPIIENEKVKGLITTQDLKKMEFWSQAARDYKGRLIVGAALGVKDTIERGKALAEAGADVLVLDVAHGHSDLVIKQLKELKKEVKVDVLVGNIATAEAAKELIEAGADGLKVGIGPSSVCTTRIISGAGVPQITAIKDVAEVAEKYGVPVCADGGITYPGDITKAIVAGADCVMIGRIFAGTDQAPGLIISKDGRRYKQYFGSASFESNIDRKERLEGKKVKENFDVFVEGVSTLVEYKGPVEDIISSLVKGVQSGISYAGARDLKGLKENGELIKITSAGWHESGSRDIK
jgi:IMP dehydrogenase